MAGWTGEPGDAIVGGMRLSLIVLLSALACGGNSAPTPEPSPAYAPAETVTVHASAGETTRRLLAIYAADGIAVASNSTGTITTAPAASSPITVGRQGLKARGTLQWFYKATVAGDSVSSVTLALWQRMAGMHVHDDPAYPDQEEPIAADCPTNPKCAPFLERMRAHAAKLRESR